MEGSSRIETARRRLRVARISIGATAAAGFLVFALAARASHPGTHHTQASSASGSDSVQPQQSDDFGFGQGSISTPSGGASTLQSGGS